MTSRPGLAEPAALRSFVPEAPFFVPWRAVAPQSYPLEPAFTPLGAAGAAFFFAAADALQRHLSLSLHAADLQLEGLFLALPYALTLLVLALGIGRTRAPAADGVPFDPEGR